MKKDLLKAYENIEFLNSPDARTLRILSEYLEPYSRFENYNIKDTVVFFGSARLKSKKDALKEFTKIKESDPNSVEGYNEKLRQAQYQLDMSKYYEDAVNKSISGQDSAESLKTVTQGIAQILTRYGVQATTK